MSVPSPTGRMDRWDVARFGCGLGEGLMYAELLVYFIVPEPVRGGKLQNGYLGYFTPFGSSDVEHELDVHKYGHRLTVPRPRKELPLPRRLDGSPVEAERAIE